MKIVSFNVNSVRMRLHQLKKLTEDENPDIIGLQETKVQDHEFPLLDLEELGYKAIYIGQKTHYGVALLYKKSIKLNAEQKGWSSDDENAQKRMIIGDFEDQAGNQVRVLNGYFPQGENREHPIKFPAKEQFYQDLMDYLHNECEQEQNLVVIGDFNISFEDQDIGIGEQNRKRWLKQGKTSFLPEERTWMKTLLDWGLEDSFRTLNPTNNNLERVLSWFDYRSKGFADEPKRGLRIDTILATKPLIAGVVKSDIGYDIRAMEKPSDHAPVWTKFNFKK